MSNHLSKQSSKTISEQFKKNQPKSYIEKTKTILLSLIPLGIAIVSRTLANILINLIYLSRLMSLYGNDFSKYINVVPYTGGEKIALLLLTSVLAYVSINIFLNKTQFGYKQDKKINKEISGTYILAAILLGVSCGLFIAAMTTFFGKPLNSIYKVDISFKGILKLLLLIMATFLGAKYKELVFRKTMPTVMYIAKMPFVVFNVIQALIFMVIDVNTVAIIPNFVLGYLLGEAYKNIEDYKETTKIHLIVAFCSLFTIVLFFNILTITPYIALGIGVGGLLISIFTFYILFKGEKRNLCQLK